MATNSPIINWSQYAALRAATGWLHCFDTEQNLRTAALLGSALYRFSPRHRRRCIDSISASYPEWPAERVADIAERSMQHMIQLFLVDAMVMPRRVTATSWPHYIRIGNLSGILDRLIAGEPIIFITGHCGNWELLGYALAVMGYPLIALARPLDNPHLNRWIMGIREARGMRIVTKWGATPVLQEALQSGGRVAFIADQNAGDQGLFVPFFGRLASSYKSIGLLAMRYRVPIATGCAVRVRGRFKYEVIVPEIIEPEEWEDQPDPLFYITARYNWAMEQMIRAAPEQYLWIHRRWKSRPRHERLGKPFPRRLIAKLETLPWLTQEQIDRMVEDSSGRTRPGAPTIPSERDASAVLSGNLS
ncbi:MAG: lysophospholipid acyltransferase family protein [Planctomycetota bacterium]|jgi:KDO2-lipid IV(A) lauroyltransferase